MDDECSCRYWYSVCSPPLAPPPVTAAPLLTKQFVLKPQVVAEADLALTVSPLEPQWLLAMAWIIIIITIISRLMYRGYKSLIVISTNSVAVYLAVVQNQNESWQSGVWLRIKASYWSLAIIVSSL